MYSTCKNTSCAKFNQSHPNCRCPVTPGMEAPGTTSMAEGGQVPACDGPHDPKCEYHMPQDSSEVFHNAVAHHGLSNLIRQTSKTDLDSLNKDPYRAFDNYVDASKKGAKKYSQSVEGSLTGRQPELRHDKENLEKYLDKFKDNPDSILESGSNISQVSPDHGAEVGAAVGAASSYLDSIKPKPQSNGPLSDPSPVSKIQMYGYERQVKMVEQPLHILKHIKDGSLQPQDIQTINTVYPKLANRLKSSIMEQVINTKSKKQEIPYKTRIALSQFLGEPMDSSLIQHNMQMAMLVNAPKPQQQPQGKKKPSSSASISQQQKVNDLYETNTQSTASKKE